MVLVPAVVAAMVVIVPIVIMMIVVGAMVVIPRAVIRAISPASRHPYRAGIVARCPKISGPWAWRRITGIICGRWRANLDGDANLCMSSGSGDQSSGSQDESSENAFHLYNLLTLQHCYRVPWPSCSYRVNREWLEMLRWISRRR